MIPNLPIRALMHGSYRDIAEKEKIMKIKHHRHEINEIVYYRVFYLKSNPNCSAQFQCQEGGDLLHPDTDAEYMTLVATGHWRGERFYDAGIEEHTRTYMQPAIGICDCGREIELSGFTNTCDCGADYNSSGQRLAPRSQWGEETGESLSDILNIP